VPTGAPSPVPTFSPTPMPTMIFNCSDVEVPPYVNTTCGSSLASYDTCEWECVDPSVGTRGSWSCDNGTLTGYSDELGISYETLPRKLCRGPCPPPSLGTNMGADEWILL
jgi:hypothetical protein